jgi:hypothetical protein
MITHFVDNASITATIDTTGAEQPVTLCGLPVEAIILKDSREPECRVCSDAHMAQGWTFPLPALVTA